MNRIRNVLKRLGTGLVVLLMAAIAGINGYQMYGRHKLLQDHPPPGALFDVGTHKMHMLCEGIGQPTVILDAGATWFSVVAWGTVFDSVGSFTRVCAFDRSGLGYSERGPSTPSVDSYVSDFHALLAASGEAPPYVLAGHSLGGGLIWLYAQERLEDIVGLVSIDGVPPGILAIEAMTGYQHVPSLLRLLFLSVERLGVINPRLTLPEQVDRSSLSPDVSDLLDRAQFLNRSPIADVMTNPELAASLENVESLGDVPVRLIASGQRNQSIFGGRRVDDYSLDAAEYWQILDAASELSTDGQVIEAPGSSHVIQFDRPEVVVETIRELVDAYRASR